MACEVCIVVSFTWWWRTIQNYILRKFVSCDIVFVTENIKFNFGPSVSVLSISYACTLTLSNSCRLYSFTRIPSTITLVLCDRPSSFCLSLYVLTNVIVFRVLSRVVWCKGALQTDTLVCLLKCLPCCCTQCVSYGVYTLKIFSPPNL